MVIEQLNPNRGVAPWSKTGIDDQWELKWEIDPYLTFEPASEEWPEELWDIEDSILLTHRADQLIFGPRAHYEREGDADDTVFPCGWTLDGEPVRMYYGAADFSLAIATADNRDVLDFILQYPVAETLPRSN